MGKGEIKKKKKKGMPTFSSNNHVQIKSNSNFEIKMIWTNNKI